MLYVTHHPPLAWYVEMICASCATLWRQRWAPFAAIGCGLVRRRATTCRCLRLHRRGAAKSRPNGVFPIIDARSQDIFCLIPTTVTPTTRAALRGNLSKRSGPRLETLRGAFRRSVHVRTMCSSRRLLKCDLWVRPQCPTTGPADVRRASAQASRAMGKTCACTNTWAGHLAPLSRHVARKEW